MLSSRFVKAARLMVSACLAIALFSIPAPARAQFFSNIYPNFFQLQQPGRLDVLLFGGGYVSDKDGDLQQGFQVEQSVTSYVGVFGRMSGYQLWIGHGFDSPLAPGSGPSARLNFGRAQGGIDFMLYPGTHLFVSGGKDFGDSNADIFEADLSSWLFLHSRHPLNFASSTIYDSENGVTSTSFDVQDIVRSTESYMVLLGGGGAMYNGGFLSGSQGQGGPDLGFYYRPWRAGIAIQAGYGSAHQYGQLSMYKTLSFLE